MSKHYRKNLSVCQTKHTETSSCSGDPHDSFGLFTFSKQDLKIPREDLTRNARQLSEGRMGRQARPIQIRAKNLEIENQILTEKIKALEIEIKNSVFEDSNILMYHIQKNQNKIEYFKEKLNFLNQEQEQLQKIRSDVEFIKALERKNAELADEIQVIKESIRLKHQSLVPVESALMLADSLKKLEEEQVSCLKANEELKDELEYLRQVNFKRSFELVHVEDQDKLFMVYVEVFRLLAVSEKFYRGETVRLKEFLEFPNGVARLTPVQLVGQIKETTRKLKIVISDVYADHCGNVCQIN